MTISSQRKKLKISKMDKAIMFAPIFATGVGLGAKKIYDFYRSKENEKIRNKINDKLKTVTPVIRQKLEEFEKSKTQAEQAEKIKELQELAQKHAEQIAYEARERESKEAQETRARLERVRQQATILEQQRQFQQQQKQKEEIERQKLRILEQRLIEELKKKQVEKVKVLEEEKKFIETQRLLSDQQQEKIQVMTAQKDFLEEMKYHSIALLKELRKTKKDILFVEQLMQNIPKSSDNGYVSEVCKVYSNINKKTFDECNKPYIQDISSCIKRSNIRYNMDMTIVNSSLSKLKC